MERDEILTTSSVEKQVQSLAEKLEQAKWNYIAFEEECFSFGQYGANFELEDDHGHDGTFQELISARSQLSKNFEQAAQEALDYFQHIQGHLDHLLSDSSQFESSLLDYSLPESMQRLERSNDSDSVIKVMGQGHVVHRDLAARNVLLRSIRDEKTIEDRLVRVDAKTCRARFETMEETAGILHQGAERCRFTVTDLMERGVKTHDIESSAKMFEAIQNKAKAYLLLLVQTGAIIYTEPPDVIDCAAHNRMDDTKRTHFMVQVRFLFGWISRILRDNLKMEALLIRSDTAAEIAAGTLGIHDAVATSDAKLHCPTCYTDVPRQQNDWCFSADFHNMEIFDFVINDAPSSAEVSLASFGLAGAKQCSRKYHILFRIQSENGKSAMRDLRNACWAITEPFTIKAKTDVLVPESHTHLLMRLTDERRHASEFDKPIPHEDQLELLKKNVEKKCALFRDQQMFSEASETLLHEIVSDLSSASIWIRCRLVAVEGEMIEWNRAKRLFLLGASSVSMKNQRLKVEETLQARQREIRGFIRTAQDVLDFISAGKTKKSVELRAYASGLLESRSEYQLLMNQLIRQSMFVVEEPQPLAAYSTDKDSNFKLVGNLEIQVLTAEDKSMEAEIKSVLITVSEAEQITANLLDPHSVLVGSIMGKHEMNCSGYSTDRVHPARLCKKAEETFISAKYKDCVLFESEDSRSRSLEPAGARETDPYHILFLLKQSPSYRSFQFGVFPQADCDYFSSVISMPVYISSSRTETKSLRGLQFWRYAFCMDDATSLSISPSDMETIEVPWNEFFSALNTWFTRVVGDNKDSSFVLERGLDEYEAQFKWEMTSGKRDSVDQPSLTWSNFYEKQRGNDMPAFWEKICSIKDYVDANFEYWESGVICIASRDQAQTILQTSQEPSVVFKFSETKPGAIVASVSSKGGPSDDRSIQHILFDDPIFVAKSLAELVRMSSNFAEVTRILPCNKPIGYLQEIEQKARKSRAKRTVDTSRVARGYAPFKFVIEPSTFTAL